MTSHKIDLLLSGLAQKERKSLLQDLNNWALTHTELASRCGVGETSVRRWRQSNKSNALSSPPKILIWDIESSPILGYTWGLWDQNVIRVKEDWKLMSVAYKWLGESKTHVKQLNDFSGYRAGDLNDKALTEFTRDLLDQCQYAVAHNGVSFDTKKAMAKIIEHGLTPPSPFTQIDTLQIARRNFKMSSNKLDSLGEILGVGRKIKHSGFDLWLQCMAGNPAAWKEMGKYAKQDVTLLESIFIKMLPWVKELNYRLFTPGFVCSNCGSPGLQQDGEIKTKISRKPSWRCLACGSNNKKASYEENQ